ncbi:MAG: FtsX-like permease family protein [Nitrososphaerota archaeon]|nr:FtsX-like permease family protein [Nitrososphaerota archaeon]MDG6922985.1 FtsX-like permease family protein [Nitrososphaerota archaeon]
MRIKDQLRLAFRAMTDRKLRTTLTIIGIIIGPATIVSLEAATQGYSNASTAQFDKLGATTLFVSPVGRSFSFTYSNIPEISNLTGVAYALPYQELTGRITQGGETVSVNIIAANLTELDAVFPSLSIMNGSLPLTSSLNQAVIGYSVAYPGLSGATNLTVNQIFTVSDVGSGGGGFFGPQSFGSSSSSSATSTKSFIVSGIYNSFGQGLFIDPDTAVFIPLSSGQTLMHSSTYSGVMVVATNVTEVTEVSGELTSLFGNDIRVTTVSSLTSSIESVTSSTGTLLASIGSISVLVAFIAIMTTEFTSVMERTKEIGILKALGANARTIMFNFIAESLVVGFIGGLIGAGLGAGLSFFIIGYLQGASSLPGLRGLGRAVFGGGGTVARTAASSTSSTVSITPSLTPELILLAIGLATAVGVLAGILPAWRASRLTPVEALRTAS